VDIQTGAPKRSKDIWKQSSRRKSLGKYPNIFQSKTGQQWSYMACQKPLPKPRDDIVFPQPRNHSSQWEVYLFTQRTSADNKMDVNVCTKYHEKTNTKPTLEKQTELLGYGYRTTDRKLHNVM